MGSPRLLPALYPPSFRGVSPPLAQALGLACSEPCQFVPLSLCVRPRVDWPCLERGLVTESRGPWRIQGARRATLQPDGRRPGCLPPSSLRRSPPQLAPERVRALRACGLCARAQRADVACTMACLPPDISSRSPPPFRPTVLSLAPPHPDALSVMDKYRKVIKPKAAYCAMLPPLSSDYIQTCRY